MTPHSQAGLAGSRPVKTSQILTVDKKRLEKRIGRLSKEKIEKVNQAIKLSLDLL
ncbi:MAG: type II toxin-antitoxin system PemK/MazF family toxin [Deltaproteobacteria bacterium]|nr:type II toxin-antitoxin system PemK/MazF family toxin [Deltaproteobacteria bacterium]